MFVEMAEIVRPVGLKGELKLVLAGDYDPGIMASPFLLLRDEEGSTRPARLQSARAKGDTLVVRLEESTSRESAEALVGVTLGFTAADYDLPNFPRPDPPSPFLYEGLKVETVQGEAVGEVEEILLWPGQRVLRVTRPDQSEVLVPAVPPILRELDRAQGKIVIDPPAGLLDDDAEIVD